MWANRVGSEPLRKLLPPEALGKVDLGRGQSVELRANVGFSSKMFSLQKQNGERLGEESLCSLPLRQQTPKQKTVRRVREEGCLFSGFLLLCCLPFQGLEALGLALEFCLFTRWHGRCVETSFGETTWL